MKRPRMTLLTGFALIGIYIFLIETTNAPFYITMPIAIFGGAIIAECLFGDMNNKTLE